jgi:hypothetical protein
MPATGAQAEAVAGALDRWLELADADDEHAIAEREQVRAFRTALTRRNSGRRFSRD